MDNGWELLSEEDEEEYQRRAEIKFKFIKFFLFVVFPLLFILGLLYK